ncbi:MAG: hypothetical protein PHS46_06060 [Candidatus Omnitrophica bacterium]|jgi:thymidylate kinase|nr:hypothetical protein [Candidatus Omnitrophota bacterium]
MKGKLIVIMGTDGSGKSTLAHSIGKIISSPEAPYNVIWGGYELLLLRPFVLLAKRILMKESSPRGDYASYDKSLKKAGTNKFAMFLYETAVLLEYTLEMFFKVTLRLLVGHGVICDRYFFDTVVNIASNRGLDENAFLAMLKHWARFFPNPDIVIFVSVPSEISMARKKDIPHIDYLKHRLYYYKTMVNNTDIITINGIGPASDVLKESLVVIRQKGGVS